MVNRISSQMCNALLPHHCALCDFPSHRSFALCAGCEQNLMPNLHACQQCGIPMSEFGHQGPEARSNHPLKCGACLTNPPPFTQVIAPWLYEECMGHLIQRWKFQKERALTPLLYALWRRRVTAPIEADVIAPIPLHWKRRWHRGFNQAALFTQCIHKGLENSPTTLHTTLLRRRRATMAQSGITAAQRQHNLVDAFTVRKRCDNLRIALVDDVVTTGATAAAAAVALKRAGAAEIQIICLARTPSPTA